MLTHLCMLSFVYFVFVICKSCSLPLTPNITIEEVSCLMSQFLSLVFVLVFAFVLATLGAQRVLRTLLRRGGGEEDPLHRAGRGARHGRGTPRRGTRRRRTSSRPQSGPNRFGTARDGAGSHGAAPRRQIHLDEGTAAIYGAPVTFVHILNCSHRSRERGGDCTPDTLLLSSPTRAKSGSTGSDPTATVAGKFDRATGADSSASSSPPSFDCPRRYSPPSPDSPDSSLYISGSPDYASTAGSGARPTHATQSPSTSTLLRPRKVGLDRQKAAKSPLHAVLEEDSTDYNHS